MSKGLEALERIIKGYDNYYLKPNSKSSLKKDYKTVEKELKALEIIIDIYAFDDFTGKIVQIKPMSVLDHKTVKEVFDYEE